MRNCDLRLWFFCRHRTKRWNETNRHINST